MSTITIISVSSLVVILGVCSGVALYYYINNEYDREVMVKEYYFSGFETSSCKSNSDCGFGLTCDSFTSTCKKSEGMSCKLASECSHINDENAMCNTFCTIRQYPSLKLDSSCPCNNGQVCVGGFCKLKYGETCNDNNNCYSSICKNNRCDSEKNNNYLQNCSGNDNCPDDYICQTYMTNDISKNTDIMKVCVSSLGGLNSICSNNSECSRLFSCDNNKCTSTIEDICPLGSIGTNVCVYSSRQSCNENDQCQSNLCSFLPKLYSFNFIYDNYSSRNIFDNVKEYYSYPSNVKLSTSPIDKFIIKSRDVTDIFIILQNGNIVVFNNNSIISTVNIKDFIDHDILDISNIEYEGNYILLLFKQKNKSINLLYIFNIVTNEYEQLNYIIEGFYDGISAITKSIICCWNSINKNVKTLDDKTQTFKTVIDEFGKPLESDLQPMFFYPKPYDLCYSKDSRINFFANSFFVPLINSDELNLIREEIKIPNIECTSIQNFSVVFDYINLNLNIMCICSNNDVNYVSVRKINIIKNFSTILEINTVIEADVCCPSLNAYYTINKSSCK